ncbi:DNA-directed RNA polymerase subunit alpha C-terminal domain-containing protein [Roseiconus nitratireducens]|nr:DNA-directed RNA polymerase subunit alpha C-terminal domain-containing protein [Roseiconus nitratireducens]
MAKTRIPLNQDWVKQQQRQQWLDSAVAELDLDVRTINGLEEDGILYVRELVQCTRQDLMKVTNFGQTTVTRVVKVLDNLGLHLRGDAP